MKENGETPLFDSLGLSVKAENPFEVSPKALALASLVVTLAVAGCNPFAHKDQEIVWNSGFKNTECTIPAGAEDKITHIFTPETGGEAVGDKIQTVLCPEGIAGDSVRISSSGR